ncbi:MAG: dUTP diphosphatase [Coriobacteriia bacterium]|nr:dUTP diphosphatase [Coriobacteriia bacterium]
MVTLPVKLFDEGIEQPSYAYAGDAGLDLRSTIDATLMPGERLMAPTGIGVALPQGYAGLVVPRSGLAAKHGISVVNAPGLIDSGYRGEIRVVLINLDPREPFQIKRGDRIAQLMVVPFAHADIAVVPELDQTERDAGGFGSSGVN